MLKVSVPGKKSVIVTTVLLPLFIENASAPDPPVMVVAGAEVPNVMVSIPAEPIMVVNPL